MFPNLLLFSFLLLILLLCFLILHLSICRHRRLRWLILHPCRSSTCCCRSGAGTWWLCERWQICSSWRLASLLFIFHPGWSRSWFLSARWTLLCYWLSQWWGWLSRSNLWSIRRLLCWLVLLYFVFHPRWRISPSWWFRRLRSFISFSLFFPSILSHADITMWKQIKYKS